MILPADVFLAFFLDYAAMYSSPGRRSRFRHVTVGVLGDVANFAYI